MTSNNMEMNENDKCKSPDGECLWSTDAEASAGKKFIIPKIRRTTEKVYLSACYTNTREYSLIHGTLKQCRLDVSCDLQFTWQFGDTKLVRNEYLEKQFAAKRSEMREGGRHSRELEEHFCFLALPQMDAVDVYQNGLSISMSAPRILGNPLLGVYLFRHVDVALRHALGRSTAIESIVVFKVLFGRVKKIQPSMDKNKVSLDPSPNFDCHMSRNMPSLKETIELQAYNSMVYFYEYDFFSRPVDKPRQCLPYAIVTVKRIGQKAGNGQLMTSLRFPSTGFPKRLERACSLNNCTVAKRIGKGKDATVIFEHFRKPADPFVQENCPCKALNSEMGPSSSDISNSYGNVQNRNNSVLETYNRQTENSSKLRDASQVYTYNSGFSFIPTDNTARGNGDLFNVTYLRSILSSISAAFPSHNNTGSSTVITSKLIKDPRLMKREQSIRNQNNAAGLSDILPFDKSLGHGDSQIKLTCMPTISISSSEVPADHTITSCLDASCFKFSSESSHCQTHNIGSKGYDCIASSRIAITEQFKEQHSSSFPSSLSNAFSDVGKQKYSEEQVQRVQMRSSVPVLTAPSSEPQNSYESENTCSNDSQGHFSQESPSSDINTIYKVGHQMSTLFPVQKKGNLCKYVQDMGMIRTFISPEDISKDEVNQTWCKETVFTNETISSPIGNSNTLYQEHKEGGNLNSLSGNCEKIEVTHKLQMPKCPMSSIGDKNELNRETSELECYLTPNIECLSQKFPQHSLEHEDNINTNFAMAQGLIELKTVQNNQNFSNILSDAFQEAKDVPLASEKLIDRVISSSAIDISLDSSVCNIIGEYTCVQRESGNGAVSPYNCHKEAAAHVKDGVQGHSLSYDAELSCDPNLKINLQEQRDENANETKEKASAPLSPEHNTDNINGSEKQDCHANDLFTNTVEMREIKSNTKVEILNSKECFTFNSFWGKKGKPAETASSESEAVEQRHAPNDRKGLEHLVSAFPEIEGSSVCVASNATKQVVGTTVLTVSTSPGDHQKDCLKETFTSESSDLGLVKHSISECEIDTDNDKLQEFHQLVNENSALKTGLGSEIEVDLEECDNASVFQQNMHSQQNDLCEEFELYESLKSRIDWEGLFGSSYEEMETSSFARREGTIQHHSTECNCVSFCSQDKRELDNPIFLPDLQITITNLLSLRISPTDESLDWKDNVYKQVSESTEPETNKEGTASGCGMCSQPSGENSSFSCENKFGNSVQESRDASKSESSHSSNSGHITHVDQGSGKPNNDSLSTEPSNVTVMNDKSKCPTELKPDFNDTRNKKDVQSRSSKRNLHASSRDQKLADKDLREHETHKKRRKLTSHNSSDCFSSLSQGRIKTFSQSERHIRNVLNILNNEASLCKSKHLSRKLNKAVLHLKKAHRRVHTSLQLISKVGQKRKGPLPKAYAIVRNNFWESCDLQGDSLMFERRNSKHFLSKRKYDKQGDKRFLRFDIEESLTPVSKHRSYRTNRERIAECLSSEVMSGHVSSSLTTFHVRDFCDEEQLPESQLPLAYTSQSISQLEYTNSIVGNASSSELEHFSETSGNMLDPKETQTEKEYQTDIQLCNNDSANLEDHSTHSIRDMAKEYSSEDKRVVCESNPVSLSFIKEKSQSPVKSYDTASKANTDMHISTLDSNKKHILNVDIYEQDNCVSDGAKNGEAIFPIEKYTVPMEATSSIPTENTASTSYSIPLVSPILVTAGEEESSVGENGLLDVNENEMNITEHSKLALTPVTEESKICKKNMKKLPCNDSSMLLKENVTGPSKRYIAKYIEEEKIRKIEQAVYKKIITEGSAVSFKYKSQNKILKEESFHVKKITTNNLTNSHLSITNSTVDTIALKDIPIQLKERKEAGQIKVSNNSHSDCLSKPAIAETNHRPDLQGNPKVSALQKELKEHHSANYTSHVTELSQILQRADEAASLQILEEETKLCQNILPLFVEAFERQQDCSVDQILISRKLLVEQNLWNNCRLKLKPCAVDAWVELQMAMETIQFIENKKRFLEGKPTFRSLLWYDESLYSELLHRPRGYQLQSNFYPGFQGRLKYNAFCELQNYHNQLVEFLTETKKENNSYYAFLKYKRQINECEAIMKHYTDCFDFCLSVPFACGVNFGDSLGDLETLRKSTLKLISEHGDSPKVYSYPGKKDHLWIIIEIVSSKVSFIKSNEEISIKICLYGLEHIYFDAAKSLVWKEKSCSLPKRHSEKYREMEEINESAFSKLKKIYGVLSKGLDNEPTSIGLQEDAIIASKQSALGSIPKCRLNKAWLSYPDISCVGEILDQAKSADLEKLHDLTLRCTDHLEILKKYFQMLQEDNIDNIFIMEENVLDMLNNHNPGAVILKPEAIEIYIEIVMISETIHYLKNLIAKKLHNPRFRGMLWFDWSLLPELIGCQEEVVSFSVGDTQTHCLWKLIETAISVLKKEVAVIYEYGEASNCSYALHLFYRELKELTGVKRLLNNSQYSVSTYIDLVPHTASVNFGNTVAELEHNYKQFFLLLKNVMSVPQKDFGKMIHIIKVMKTIEHMKVLSAKDTKLSTHLLFLQMLRNKRNALQQNRQEKMETPVIELEDNSQPGVSEQTPPDAECTVKNISGSSKKRPVTADTCEVSQGKGNTDTVSSWKKQKVTTKDVGNRQTISKHPSTTGSPLIDENKIGSNSSDSLKSISASPEVIKRQSSVPGSVSPAKSVQDTYTPKSDSKVEPKDSSPDILASLTEQPGNSNDIEKIIGNFSAAETNNKEDCPLVTCNQKDIDASCSPDHTPAQKSHKIPVDHTQISPSNVTAGNDDPLVPDASLLSLSASQSVKDIHGSLEMSGTDFHHENNEILDLSTEDCTCTSSPEPVCIQDKIPVLRVDKAQPVKSESPEKYMTDAPNPNTAPFGSYGNSALVSNGTIQHTTSEQNPKVLTQKFGTSRNKPPRSACSTVYNSSAHSFGTSYPYYSWCFYQYSSSSGTAVTHTYQGMTAYEIQQPPPPPPMLTTVTSTVQNTHFNRSYSEHFSYFAGQPQANSFIPGNGYFPSHTPVSYNYQQPIYSQFASSHPVPQTAYPYPPNPGVLPQVPWTYAPWQQNPFPRRH